MLLQSPLCSRLDTATVVYQQRPSYHIVVSNYSYANHSYQWEKAGWTGEISVYLIF